MPNDNLDEKIQDAQSNLDTLTAELTKRAEELFGETKITTKNLKEYTEQLRRQKRGIQEDIKSKEIQNKIVQEVIKEEQNRLKVLKKQNEEAKKPGFWQKMLGTANQDNSFEQMYRVRQRFGGIEQILTGNIGSGLSQFAGSFKMISNVMGGPLFLAIQTVTSGLLRLDKAIAETRNQVTSATGGALSPFRGDYVGSLTFRNQLQTGLRKYGQQGEWKELAMTSLQSTGLGSIINKSTGKIDDTLLAERALTQGSTLKYMTSMGISADTVNKIFRINRNLERMDEIGAQSSQYRLAKLFSTSRSMTTQEGAEQAVSLYEQTKSLGINFEWAARTVRRFDDALQKGEISLNDFAAISRGIRGADQGKAAGLASMLKDYAIRTGLELPQEFMRANDVEAGLLLQTSKYLGDPNIKRAISGWTKEQSSNMGFSNTAAGRATALRTFAGGIFGAQITPDMWLKAGQTGDLTPMLGQKEALPTIPEQDKQALEVDKEALNLHKEELSIAGAIKEELGQIVRDLQTGIVVQIDRGQWNDITNMSNIMMPGQSVNAWQKAITTGSDVNKAYSSPLMQPK